MEETLRKIFLKSFSGIFFEQKKSLPIFESAFKNLTYTLEKEKVFCVPRFILKNKHLVKKLFEGWLYSYYPASQRKIALKVEELSFLDFVSLFHPDRKMRLLFDKLRRKLDLNVTSICNYNCSYCYQRSRDSNWEKNAKKVAEKELPIKDYKRVVKEASALGAKYLKITGGEPLTRQGVIELIEFALNIPDYKEVELLSNGSLINGSLDELKRVIKGREERFHLHTSIDGLDFRSDDNNKFSKKHFDMLKNLFSQLKEIKISVNSMWTETIAEESTLWELYQLMYESEIKRWTISFPYLVRDLRVILEKNPQYLPDFKKVVDLSEGLIKRHEKLNFPFQLSIPLIYKHEINDSGYSVSCGCFDNHPCFPCHGSYLIIGPKGEIMECLLAKPSTNINIKNNSLLTAMINSTINNSFYSLDYQQVSSHCKNCRYELLCQGQCLNDKLNTSDFKFKKSNIYKRDIRACSLIALSEEQIWPILKKYNGKISSYLNLKGFFPAVYKNLSDVLANKPPISTDHY